jgi:hypothetical protein
MYNQELELEQCLSKQVTIRNSSGNSHYQPLFCMIISNSNFHQISKITHATPPNKTEQKKPSKSQTFHHLPPQDTESISSQQNNKAESNFSFILIFSFSSFPTNQKKKKTQTPRKKQTQNK